MAVATSSSGASPHPDPPHKGEGIPVGADLRKLAISRRREMGARQRSLPLVGRVRVGCLLR